MQRRKLIKMAALAAGATTVQSIGARTLFASKIETPDPRKVERVLIVSKCHLDVGYTDTQAKVLRKYFDVYYPQAIATAARLRAEGPDRYTWTTGSFLLYEYLEQADSQQRRQMEEAIAAGDITWHALPFTWQTEMLDPSMIRGAMSLSATLDQRFGHKTVSAKMTDVTGHSRGLIGPLAAAGVRMLDIGVNGATIRPETPPVFLWRDQNNASVVMIYHPFYGGTVPIPGTTTAFSMEVANDNAGPHSPTQIAATYARLRTKFPNAKIQASNLNEVAMITDPVRDRLPIITQEIGDTWIYGVPGDPPKVARYRETARLRRQWLEEKKFEAGDATDRRLLRRLLLAVEHTWGTDTKTYIDYDHYTIPQLKQVLADPGRYPGYKIMTASWQEKRDDISEAIASLPPGLYGQLKTRLAGLSAALPSKVGLTPHIAGDTIRTRHYTLAFDPGNGSIIRLKNNRTDKEWASPERPLALFTYQTLSAVDYADFLRAYVISKDDWVHEDFAKPNIGRFGAVSREWHPTLTKAWSGAADGRHRVLLELKIDDPKTAAAGLVAWPAVIYLELTLPDDEPTVGLRLQTFGKIANRLPESMWLTFHPETKDASVGAWELEKVGLPLRPSEVIRGGGRVMHAVSEDIRYVEESNMFQLSTLDAPVVSLDRRSSLNFSLDSPDLKSGFHINLFNNAWGVNYPQWCEGDWSYRFILKA